VNDRRMAQRRWIAKRMLGIAPIGAFHGGDAELLALANEEGVAALLAEAMRGDRALAEDHAAKHWNDIARSAVALEMARFVNLRDVLEALSADEVSVLVLKGSALAYWLFQRPSDRSRCDLDLLVDGSEQAQRATECLRKLGFRTEAGTTETASGFELALVRETAAGLVHRIDLHWRMLNHALLARGFAFRELWEARLPLPALHPQAFGLGRVHALAHALLHRVTNMPLGQQDRLIWLYDIHLLASGASADEWQAFVHLCGDKGIATPCLDGLAATRSVFGTAVPADVESALHQRRGVESWRLGSSVDQGTMDRTHLAALHWPERAVWLRRKLFPPADFMRYRYGATTGPELVRAYCVRWWVGLRRGLGW